MNGDVEAAFVASNGTGLLGTFYIPDEEGPRPSVVLLHALPGNEKNLDLAHELRRLGIGCLVLYFRGAWGSGGDFDMDSLVPDARSALNWLARHARVDAGQLGLIGWSLGGWAALATAALDDRVRAVVALAPLLDPATADIPPGLAEQSARVLHGTTAQAITEGWRSRPSVLGQAAALARKPVLLVTADADTIFPIAHYGPLREKLPSLEWVRFPQADHAFLSVRPGLCHTVSHWLLDHLGVV